MKIINYKDEGSSEAKTGLILRELEHLVCKYVYLVPNGWRFIIKMQVNGEAEPYYYLDVQSDKGGGDYAEAKMSTLELFPDRAATGGDSIRDLVNMIASQERTDNDWVKRIFERENVDQLTDETWEWLRDEVKITPCYGGIRIPYKDQIIGESEITDETGEIRIAFSGASQEQDIFFALGVFNALNDSFVRLYPNTQGWLNLSELEEIPAIKFWLDIFQINEA